MKYVVESGDAKVEIEISSESTELMRAVEESATRLLSAALNGKPESSKPAFGYSVAADTELAAPHPPVDDEEPDA